MFGKGYICFIIKYVKGTESIIWQIEVNELILVTGWSRQKRVLFMINFTWIVIVPSYRLLYIYISRTIKPLHMKCASPSTQTWCTNQVYSRVSFDIQWRYLMKQPIENYKNEQNRSSHIWYVEMNRLYFHRTESESPGHMAFFAILVESY